MTDKMQPKKRILPPGMGGRQEGSGRKALPPERRKERIVGYVEPAVKQWIEENGGSRLVSEILSEAHVRSLIV